MDVVYCNMYVTSISSMEFECTQKTAVTCCDCLPCHCQPTAFTNFIYSLWKDPLRHLHLGIFMEFSAPSCPSLGLADLHQCWNSENDGSTWTHRCCGISWDPIVPAGHMLPLFHHCGSLEISPISCSLRNLCLNFSWRKTGRPVT